MPEATSPPEPVEGQLGSRPIRLVQVGAGSMGRAWLRNLAANPDVILVGLVDLDEAVARQAAVDHGFPDVVVGSDLGAVLAAVSADAVVNVTIPIAHRPVSEQALAAGLDVLCEKPLADSMIDAQAMVDAAAASGRLLMVSQSRRYWRQLTTFRRQIAQLGRIGSATCTFFKAPHFGGFREVMAEPLLVDMAIHQFDLARLIIGSDPTAVHCESYNPTWSWYRGNAAANAMFTFTDGTRFTFTGSWCAPGQETSWNGAWRVSGESGTATWDGDQAPVAELADGTLLPAEIGDEPEEIAGSLAEFVACLRSGARPDTEAARNIVSLAMVEAAVLSSSERRRIELAEVLPSPKELVG